MDDAEQRSLRGGKERGRVTLNAEASGVGRRLSGPAARLCSHKLLSQQRELKAKSWSRAGQVGLYLMETTRLSISSSRAALKTARAAGGGAVVAAPYFRKQVIERIRNTVVERNTSRRELKVALAKVFTGEFFITCSGVGGEVGGISRSCNRWPWSRISMENTANIC